jgi:sulfite exporter TauE/SafE
MLTWITTAFLTGFLSSLHCVGMCGPLTAALPVGHLSARARWRAAGLYHTGRIGTYATLGVLAGSLGFGLTQLGWQRPFSVAGGLALLIVVFWHNALPARLRWPWLNTQIIRRFQQLLRQPGGAGLAGLGMLNGLLPCGSTYLALTGTLATQTPFAGATYMLLFGLGTLPALLSTSLLTGWLTVSGRRRLNRLRSVAAVIVAALLLLRGFTDYASPAPSAGKIPVCHGLPTP